MPSAINTAGQFLNRLLATISQAAQHWELALGVNPLHPEGWFALGYCALKRRNFVRAAQAFSRCAQQQPDNGDAWNNLAAIHLQASGPCRAHSVYPVGSCH